MTEDSARPAPFGAAVELTEEEVRRRKEFLEFTQEDERRLVQLQPLAEKYADDVIEELYEHLLRFDETRKFLQDPRVLERVKALQKEYFLRLTQGDYGAEYVRNRVQVGVVHERIGLDHKWYLGAYRRYLQSVMTRLLEEYKDRPRLAIDAFMSLKKLMYLDIGIALDRILVKREGTIRAQQDAIRELSTPVLQLRDRLLILPIIGMIDSQRARQLTEQLLRAIRANRAKVVVMDITGVPAVDSKVANHLLQTADACRLMGARAILTGLSAGVAQALVTLGVDLTRVHTVGDLQGGIEEAERILGYRVTRIDGESG
ncbi:MAG: protoglobin domain-containing protein [Planctomycetota bacterium]